MSEQFWFHKPQELVHEKYLRNFIPQKTMTIEQNLNAVVRLTWYFAIIMFFVAIELKYFMIPLAAMVGTIAIYFAKNAKSKQAASQYEAYDNMLKQNCTKPTLQNPYMNVLLTEYAENPQRPMACDPTDRRVRNKMGEIFEARLFRDVDDMYSDFTDRQFYTMPSTTIPNNQNEFANWLYGTENTKCRKGYELKKI